MFRKSKSKIAKPKPPVPYGFFNYLGHGGGVFKRIDEMRELWELLNRDEDGQKFLDRNSWVQGWLLCEDEFLCAFLNYARTLDPQIDEAAMDQTRFIRKPIPSSLNNHQPEGGVYRERKAE